MRGIGLGCFVLISCAGVPAGEQRSSLSARGFQYSDEAGLDVTTVAVTLEQPTGDATTLEGVGLVERIRIGTPESASPELLGAGHQHGSEPGAAAAEVDVISSASSTARVVTDNTLLRYEAQLGARRGVGSNTTPADIGLEARFSTEPDYQSLGVALSARLDLLERNLTAAAFLSIARDSLDPEVVPPGQANDWPAEHRRIFVGASLSQVLGPTTLLGGSAGLGRQAGTLENPYRRVLVRTTLFPERVPDQRIRFTASLSLAQYLGSGSAFHFRNGMYSDSWGVEAWIPELALAKELGSRLLLSVHGRWYSQGGARFYRHHYDELQQNLTADIRLGSLSERAAGVYAAFVALRAPHALGELSIDAAYERSVLVYRELAASVAGDLVSAGVVWRP